MAGERTLNWGADATDAQYRTGDDDAENRFVLVEDTDGGTILLEYDETASEWVSRGPVNMSGNDVSNVGTLTADAVDVDALNYGIENGSVISGNRSLGDNLSKYDGEFALRFRHHWIHSKFIEQHSH